MAASEAAVANLALSHLGVAGTLVTLSSDTTTNGKACRMFYERSVRETLAATPWQCAKKRAALTLVETFTEPAEWLYSYRLPEDCVAPRRLLWEGIRNPRADQEPPFVQGADTDSTDYAAGTTYATGAYAKSASIWYRALRETVGDTPASSAEDWVALEGGPPKLLLCDLEDAELEYTMMLDDPTRFDTALESAIAALLAYYVAPSVTINASAVDLRRQILETWDFLVQQAKMNDFNARKRDLPPISGYQAARVLRRR